jgi:hypothetical protein
MNFLNQTNSRAVTQIRPSQTSKIFSADKDSLGANVAKDIFTFKMSAMAEVFNFMEAFTESANMPEALGMTAKYLGVTIPTGLPVTIMKRLQRGLKPNLYSWQFWEDCMGNSGLPFIGRAQDILDEMKFYTDFSSFTLSKILNIGRPALRSGTALVNQDFSTALSEARNALNAGVPMKNVPYFGLIIELLLDDLQLMVDKEARTYFDTMSDKELQRTDSIEHFLPRGGFPAPEMRK